MHFSEREKHDLIVAWLLISIAFAIYIYRYPGQLADLVEEASLYTLVFVAAVTVGVGFMVHELAHKYVGQYYGKYAEFHAALPMLVLMVFLSFLGIFLAAPGAVIISGYSTRRELGHIALAGPVSNIVLALLALPLFFLIQTGFWGTLIQLFYTVNVWLALFNMLPFWVFDGEKIIRWSKTWYFVTLLAAAGLFILTWLPR